LSETYFAVPSWVKPILPFLTKKAAFDLSGGIVDNVREGEDGVGEAVG
jgi:hypothetical protein